MDILIHKLGLLLWLYISWSVVGIYWDLHCQRNRMAPVVEIVNTLDLSRVHGSAVDPHWAECEDLISFFVIDYHISRYYYNTITRDRLCVVQREGDVGFPYSLPHPTKLHKEPLPDNNTIYDDDREASKHNCLVRHYKHYSTSMNLFVNLALICM